MTIPLVAANTSRIRVGSGSVLLNHYSPFKVAEVFTLLGDMFPGRIDMGIGRATTGPASDFALQRNRSTIQNNEDSEEQLKELLILSQVLSTRKMRIPSRRNTAIIFRQRPIDWVLYDLA